MKLRLILYEIIVIILSLIGIIIAFLDITYKINASVSPWLYLEYSVIAFFTVDYIVRFYKADNKKTFFVKNIPDLIAILPFNTIFGFLRIARIANLLRFAKIFRLVRLLVFIKKFYSVLDKFLRTNGFIYSLYITVITILIGSVAIYNTELGHSVKSYEDALWWSFVTTTTVGYGDISPQTTKGRFIAAVMMIVGIGFISMLTGTIATFFFNRKKEISHSESSPSTIDISDMSEDERLQINNFIEFLRSKRS